MVEQKNYIKVSKFNVKNIKSSIKNGLPNKKMNITSLHIVVLYLKKNIGHNDKFKNSVQF